MKVQLDDHSKIPILNLQMALENLSFTIVKLSG